MESNVYASVAIFGPQSKNADADYVRGLRNYLLYRDELKQLVETIHALPQIWNLYADHRVDIKRIKHGKLCAQRLVDWIEKDEQAPLSEGLSGILALPLLVIIQITLYLQYLELKGIDHSTFLRSLRPLGGVQGYCGGFLAAVAVSCAKSESEVVQNACKALHIALGIGAYSDLEEDIFNENATHKTAIIRLKHDRQDEELLKGINHV